jgi:hypothetical protein
MLRSASFDERECACGAVKHDKLNISQLSTFRLAARRRTPDNCNGRLQSARYQIQREQSESRSARLPCETPQMRSYCPRRKDKSRAMKMQIRARCSKIHCFLQRLEKTLRHLANPPMFVSIFSLSRTAFPLSAPQPPIPARRL